MSTRFLVCGDIHCKPHLLLKALEATKWDTFIFLGDACDNWGATQEDNLATLNTIIDIKKKYGKKFVWLLGNHDWGYYDDTIRMSGHILAGSANVQYLLEQNIDLWDIFYSDGANIYTHAGFSRQSLLMASSIPYADVKKVRGVNNPLNQVGTMSGGYSVYPSCIWARPEELNDLGELCEKQIVGHTPVPTITEYDNVIVCDTMSQHRDGTSIGDNSLLLIERDDLWHDKRYVINIDNGEVIRELQ